MKVLVVEDDVDLRVTIAELLRQSGNEVALAGSGDEALARAEEFHPEVVLVDVLLPDFSGLMLASVLRGLAEDRPIRVVGLSGCDDEVLAHAHRRRIFDAVLQKPVAAAQLLRAIGPLIQSSDSLPSAPADL
jgi:CheY-like chemotaxis protein